MNDYFTTVMFAVMAVTSSVCYGMLCGVVVEIACYREYDKLGYWQSRMGRTGKVETSIILTIAIGFCVGYFISRGAR